MFFPIRSDRRLHSTPWVNVTLIVINVVVFAFTHNRLQEQGVAAYFLDPGLPRLFPFITYQFMHANLLHLAGNMVFLYVFGNSVEDRLGKAGYLAFYLAGGILAGLGHALVETVPVLGASGAVAAVTGAYLALFPLSNVTMLYWFFIPGTFEVSGVVLILFQIATNFVLWGAGEGSVAYAAHLAGYIFGFFVGMTLLWVRVLPREPYDMLALWEQKRRREQFRNLTRQGYRPWEHEPEAGVVLAADGTPSAGSADPRVIELRARIAADVTAHRLDAAAAAYEELLAIAPNAVLAQQQQIDVANQLMAVGKFHSAAQAYELFLTSYRADPHRDQVELILGVLCARYLDRKDRGKELLAAALLRLQDPQQRQLAQSVLGEIGG
ncbi:MAG: rhomboid family intramembrane serine protease [Planctomycetes bacterium]|nr:rhomboid family intramembrane serine protease [Planctomycetota bacterium]